jgi:hypothetical protein
VNCVTPGSTVFCITGARQGDIGFPSVRSGPFPLQVRSAIADGWVTAAIKVEHHRHGRLGTLQKNLPLGTPQLGEVHPARRPLLSANQDATPPAKSPLRRQKPREEPGALAAHPGSVRGRNPRPLYVATDLRGAPKSAAILRTCRSDARHCFDLTAHSAKRRIASARPQLFCPCPSSIASSAPVIRIPPPRFGRCGGAPAGRRSGWVALNAGCAQKSGLPAIGTVASFSVPYLCGFSAQTFSGQSRDTRR